MRVGANRAAETRGGQRAVRLPMCAALRGA
jgi:hypothetical protein